MTPDKMTNPDRFGDVLTTAECADMLSVTRAHLAVLRDDHGLPAHDISASGGRALWRYVRADVIQWVRSRCSAPGAAHDGTEVAA